MKFLSVILVVLFGSTLVWAETIGLTLIEKHSGTSVLVEDTDADVIRQYGKTGRIVIEGESAKRLYSLLDSEEKVSRDSIYKKGTTLYCVKQADKRTFQCVIPIKSLKEGNVDSEWLNNAITSQLRL